RERPGDVLEQARAVPGVDGDLDAEAALDRALLPLHGREPLGVPLQRLHVRTIVAVDRDALPERDVADNAVAGDRRTALGEPHEHVVDALDVDTDLTRRDRPLRLRRPERNRLLFGHL